MPEFVFLEAPRETCRRAFSGQSFAPHIKCKWSDSRTATPVTAVASVFLLLEAKPIHNNAQIDKSTPYFV